MTVLLAALVLAIGIALISLSSNLSMAVYALGRPLWYSESLVASPFKGFIALLQSKQTLVLRTKELMEENAKLRTEAQDRNLLKAENETLRELFNRKPEENQYILADILARPGFLSYDSLVLNVGSDDGVHVGQTIYAGDYLPIGTISNVAGSISTATLFSNPGTETPVLIGEATTTPGTAVGKGGGNFEVKLPQSIKVKEGDPVRFAAQSHLMLGTVAAITTNPTDSFEKALFTLPVNIQETLTVLIEKTP